MNPLDLLKQAITDNNSVEITKQIELVEQELTKYKEKISELTTKLKNKTPFGRIKTVAIRHYTDFSNLPI
ncbi:MAG: hypothetical protein D3918_11800 [Candidatus Electrothrix sp. AX2]|nr:hypothetical protein [Candidatus Electrothrix gigas]